MNFIEVYDNVLSKEECELLIRHFENVDPCRKQMNAVNKAKKIGTTLMCDWEDDLFDDFHNIIRDPLEAAVQRYKKKHTSIDKICPWNQERGYNVQRFDDGGGYITLNCEQDGPMVSRRMLVWMIYLNDAKSGTEFPNQRKTTRAKTGRIVIWPAAWTHMHKGVIPNKGVKYMATGWCEYASHEKLFCSI